MSESSSSQAPRWPKLACEDEDSDIGVKLTVSFKLTVSLKTVSDDGSEQLGCFSFLLTHVLSLCRRGLASYYSQLLQLGIFPAVFKPQLGILWNVWERCTGEERSGRKRQAAAPRALRGSGSTAHHHHQLSASLPVMCCASGFP